MKGKELQNKLQKIISLAEECQVILSTQKHRKHNGNTRRKQKNPVHVSQKREINFNLNSRAFFKQNVKSLTGPKKYTLVVAYLTKGKVGQELSSDKIKACWDKHSKLLGGKLKSGVYGTRAKESGWLDDPKYGFYCLTKDWVDISD